MVKEFFLSGVEQLFNAFRNPKIDIKGFNVQSVKDDAVTGFLVFSKEYPVIILEDRIPLKITHKIINKLHFSVSVKNDEVLSIKSLENKQAFFSVEDFMSLYHPVRCVCGVVSVPLSNHFPEKCVCGRFIDIDNWNAIKVLTVKEVIDFIGGDKNAL